MFEWGTVHVYISKTTQWGEFYCKGCQSKYLNISCNCGDWQHSMMGYWRIRSSSSDPQSTVTSHQSRCHQSSQCFVQLQRRKWEACRELRAAQGGRCYRRSGMKARGLWKEHTVCLDWHYKYTPMQPLRKKKAILSLKRLTCRKGNIHWKQLTRHLGSIRRFNRQLINLKNTHTSWSLYPACMLNC